MVGRSALRIGVAYDIGARIAASRVTVLVIRTVVVADAFGSKRRNDADDHIRRGGGALHQSPSRVADASAVGRHDEAARRVADASAVRTADLAALWHARLFRDLGNGYLDALLSGIALGSRRTDADHRSVRNGRSDFTISGRGARL